MVLDPDTDTREIVIVAILTIVGGLFRVTRIRGSLGGDEFFTAAMMTLPLPEIIVNRPTFHVPPILWTDITPPLYYVGTELVSLVLGTGDIVLRLLPWLAGVATISAIYLLGRELWDRRAGLGAALLLTVSDPHILYSQRARAYTLFLLLTTISMLFLIRTLRTRSQRDMIGFMTATVAALYTSYLAGFLLIGAGLVLLYRRDDIMLRRWLVAGAGIVLLYLPQLPELLGTPPSSEVVARPMTLIRLQDILMFLFNDTAGILIVGSLASLAVIHAYRSGRTAITVPIWFLLAGLSGTLLIALSGTLRPRYAFPLLIPLLLIAGRGLTLPRRWLSGVVVLLMLVAAVSSAAGHQYDAQPWETVVDYIEEHDGSETVIIHNSEFEYAFHRYGEDRDRNLQRRFKNRPDADRVLGREEFLWINRIDQPLWLVLRPRDQGIPSSISLLAEQYNVTGIRIGDITVLRLGEQAVHQSCPTTPDDHRPGRPAIRCSPVTVQASGLVRAD